MKITTIYYLKLKGKKQRFLKFLFRKSNVRTKTLKSIIASGEDKFWKIISRNTVLSENLINLDKRLLSNYYKSLGFYDAKINSNYAKIVDSENAELIYSIEEGKRFTIGKNFYKRGLCF